MGNQVSCDCDSSAVESDPIFAVLATKGLQAFYARITTDLGVTTLQSLRRLGGPDMDAALRGIGMRPVQRKLLKELVAELAEVRTRLDPRLET